MKKRRWLWIVLFIWLALLLGTLATSWSVVFVRDYFRMVELARHLELPGELHAPWIPITLGLAGFLAAMGTGVMFFVRLLGEMRLNQLQSEFLARVTHELKTPIAAIELSSSLIQDALSSADNQAASSPEEMQSLWETHGRELGRLKRDVETLLEAARWQSPGAPRKEPRKTSTPILLESWLTEATTRWKSILGPGATLAREGERLAAHAVLDLRTFNLITDNLLDNAKKFAKGAPNVLVRTRKLEPKRSGQPARWQIQIEDHGWGFDPQDTKRIFRRFVRVRSGAPDAVPGTGLGLHLAREASRALGLRLTGASRGMGKGAVFTLEGPCREPGWVRK